MAQFYCVYCKTEKPGSERCSTALILELETGMSKNRTEFPRPPLEPLVCPICRESHQYSSNDVFRAVLPEPVLSYLQEITAF
jgi:hypothetical protein